jgi:hypothetical protein
MRDRVLAMTDEAGMDRATVICTVQHESSWNSNPKPHVNDNGTIDKGLWQINSIHKQPDSITLDPIKSTEYAINLWRNQGFSPWMAYTTYCR